MYNFCFNFCQKAAFIKIRKGNGTSLKKFIGQNKKKTSLTTIIPKKSTVSIMRIFMKTLYIRGFHTLKNKK